jgi:hypothetical protein
MNTARLHDLARQGVALSLTHSACCLHKKDSKAPEQPDYTGAAIQQAETSKENTLQQTYANRPQQVTPWGTINWATQTSVDPATGQPVTAWRQTQTLDPKTQAALDQQMALQQQRSQLAGSFMNRVRDEYGQPIDYSRFAQGGQSINTGILPAVPGSGNQATQQSYERMMQMAAPERARQQEALNARLSAMGVPMSSQAYKTQQSNLSDQLARQQLGIQEQALAQGRAQAQLQQQLRQSALGEQMQIGSYQDTLRQRQIAEEAMRRGMSLNEMNALLSGQQVGSPSMPAFQGATKADATNFLGAAQAAGNFDMQNYQAQMQNQGNTMGDIASLAGTAAMFAFSDQRLKTDIVCVGQHPIGVGIYEYSIFGRRGRGVIAQELLEVAPHLVARHSSGFLMVNYGGL